MRSTSEQRLSYTPSSDRRGRYETDGSLEHGFRSSMGPQRRPFKAPPARYLSWLREISDNSGRQADHNCIAESYLVVRGFLALFFVGRQSTCFRSDPAWTPRTEMITAARKQTTATKGERECR